MRRLAAAVVLAVVASTLVGGAAANAEGVRNGEYWLDDYGIRNAWDTSKGRGVTIANG